MATERNGLYFMFLGQHPLWNFWTRYCVYPLLRDRLRDSFPPPFQAVARFVVRGRMSEAISKLSEKGYLVWTQARGLAQLTSVKLENYRWQRSRFILFPLVPECQITLVLNLPQRLWNISQKEFTMVAWFWSYYEARGGIGNTSRMDQARRFWSSSVLCTAAGSFCAVKLILKADVARKWPPQSRLGL